MFSRCSIKRSGLTHTEVPRQVGAPFGSTCLRPGMGKTVSTQGANLLTSVHSPAMRRGQGSHTAII